MTSERKRVAAYQLRKLGKFPIVGQKCMEIGYGGLGWLADLITWGVRESDLYGIELSETRAEQAKLSLPCANLYVGNATELPWGSGFFDLIVASTVFSSILDSNMRRSIAKEMCRVLNPNGAIVWYDLAVDNPRNKSLRKLDRRELQDLFPEMVCTTRSITLAPPISRLVTRYSWTTATILSCLPFLRTHYLAVLVPR